MPKPLRAVQPGEAPPKARKQSVVEAAESGDYRSLLVSMRDRIAKTVSDPDCPPRDLASLSRRLNDIGKELEQIDARMAGEDEDAGAGSADEKWDAEAL